MNKKPIGLLSVLFFLITTMNVFSNGEPEKKSSKLDYPTSPISLVILLPAVIAVASPHVKIMIKKKFLQHNRLNDKIEISWR